MSADRRNGFTLVELLVVLVVLGALLSLAPAAFQRIFPGQELRAAAGDVAATLRQARGQAIRDNRDAAVSFDLEAGTYRLDGWTETPTLASGIEVVLHTAVSEQDDGTSGRIRFFPDGTSTGGGVTLARDGRSYDVLVDWLTGRVQVVE